MRWQNTYRWLWVIILKYINIISRQSKVEKDTPNETKM